MPGEDPLHTGNYAMNFVHGLQGETGGLDDNHTQVAACCKHFIANSLEDWEGHTRYDFDAQVLSRILTGGRRGGEVWRRVHMGRNGEPCRHCFGT